MSRSADFSVYYMKNVRSVENNSKLNKRGCYVVYIDNIDESKSNFHPKICSVLHWLRTCLMMYDYIEMNMVKFFFKLHIVEITFLGSSNKT